MSIETMSLEKSNAFVEDLLKKEEPFIISRVGIGSETQNAYSCLIGEKPTGKIFGVLENNAGVYNINDRERIQYGRLYLRCLKNSVALATFHTAVVKEQKEFIEKYNLEKLHSRVIEPYHCINAGIKPWTLLLKGKKKF